MGGRGGVDEGVGGAEEEEEEVEVFLMDLASFSKKLRRLLQV